MAFGKPQDHADTLFTRLLQFCERRRYLLGALVLAATGAAALAMPFIRISTRLDSSLPSNTRASKALEFLDKNDLAAEVVIEVVRDAPPASPSDQDSRRRLMATLDLVRTRLNGPLISKVLLAEPERGMPDAVRLLGQHAPALLGADELADFEEQLTDASIDTRLREHRDRVMKPMGFFGSNLIRSDPLGLEMVVWKRLSRLAAPAGYRIVIADGRFLGSDGNSGLVIAETTASVSSSAECRSLVNFLDGAIADLPPGFKASFYCAHAHTASNELAAIHDIRLSAIVANVFFFALLVFFFRDARALLILFVPLCACCISTAFYGFAFGGLALMIAGLCAAFAGMAIDYAIHTYVAVRSASNRVEAVRETSLPVLAAYLTTAVVFLVLLFSPLPYYRQMGFLALMSLGLSLAIALFVFPWFVPPRPAALGPQPAQARPSPRVPPRVVIAIFIAAMIAIGIQASKTRFDPSVANIDGTSKQILIAEKDFNTRWSSSQNPPAMITLTANTITQLLDRNWEAWARITRLDPAAARTNLAPVLPPRSVQERNCEAWSTFWTPERRERLRTRLNSAGARHGFAPDAFDPFLKLIEKPAHIIPEEHALTILRAFGPRFFRENADGFTLLSYVPDEAGSAPIFQSLDDIPGLLVISQRQLMAELSSAFSSDTSRIAILGAAGVALLTVLLCRDLATAALALLPALCGLAVSVALPSIVGRPLNIADAIACVMVQGLCVDYGIYMALARKRGLDLAPIKRAVSLCALTTLSGTSALVLAQHRCLHSLGVTLTAGLIAGWLVAILVLPALFTFFRRASATVPVCALLFVFLLAGCQTARQMPVTKPLSALAALPEEKAFDSISLITFRRGNTMMNSVAALSFDGPHRRFTLALLMPPAMSHLLDLKYDSGRIHSVHALAPPGSPPGIARLMANTVAMDIERTYFHATPTMKERMHQDAGGLVFERGGRRSSTAFRWSRSPSRLAEKSRSNGGAVDWRITYSNHKLIDGVEHPMRIEIENLAMDYRLGILVTSITPR